MDEDRRAWDKGWRELEVSLCLELKKELMTAANSASAILHLDEAESEAQCRLVIEPNYQSVDVPAGKAKDLLLAVHDVSFKKALQIAAQLSDLGGEVTAAADDVESESERG